MQHTKLMKHRRRIRKHARGQSLVEVSLSLVVLLLIAFGLIDLGRAFFTTVSMNSIISEGANWGAAYPGCIPSATNTTAASQVPSQCQGTNSVLCRMMNENTNLDPARVTDLSVTPINAQPGQVVTLSMTYRLPIITPIIQAMFGSDFTLTTKVQEVVRGDDVPDKPGSTAAGMCSQGGVAPVGPVSNVQQNPVACNAGSATFTWTAVSATGYRIWRSNVSAPLPATADVTLPAGGIAPGDTYTWTDPNPLGSGGAGGSRNYTITAYNQVGSGPITDSTPVYFSGSCLPIQVTGLTAGTCSGNGINLVWTPPGGPNANTLADTSIAGYAVIDAGTNMRRYNFPGRATANGNYVFQTDPVAEGSATIYMRPYDSSNNLIGLPSTSPTTVVVNCPPTNAEVSVNVTDSPDPVIVGNPLTFTITIHNAGPATANGVQVTDVLSTSGGAAFTFVSATPSQGTCSYAAPTVSCNIGSIANGGNATINVVVTPTATGSISSDASETQTTQDMSPIDNHPLPQTATVITTPTAGVSLSALIGPSSVTVGNAAVYTITVSVTPGAAATNVVLTAPTPAGLTYQTATGACAATGVNPCNLGTLAAGSNTNIQVTYIVPASYVSPNPFTYTASVSSPDDSTPGDNSRSKQTNVSPGAIQNFHFVSCTYNGGGQRTYTFTWNAFNWPGVDHFRIKDQYTSETWSSASGTGSATSMTIPPTGTIHKSHSDDLFYIEALNASNVVVGSRSVPSVTTTCS